MLKTKKYLNKKFLGVVLVVAVLVLSIIVGLCVNLKGNKVKNVIAQYPSSFIDNLAEIDKSGVNDKVWLIDFSEYKEDKTDPGAYFCVNVAMGSTYTFSFDYCVVGESLGTTVVNAASEWKMGSKVQLQNNRLQGNGSYSAEFKADYPYFYPVFQTHIPKGKPKLYIWNLSLVKQGESKNYIKNLSLNKFEGDMAQLGLVSVAKIDTSELKGTIVETTKNPICLFDFEKYSGGNKDPGAFLRIDVEYEKEYTFSFDYCVIGESDGTSIINAACDWGMGSKVKFNNGYLTGKGTYSITFTADYPQIYPVFQTNTDKGKPKLYVWNLKLIQKGSKENAIEELSLKSFQGDLNNENLISFVNINTDTLKPTVKTVNYIAGNTWLLDFSKYSGNNENPNALFNADVESGERYEFSFDYCVIGETTGTRVINAACDWGMGSKVKFDNGLLTGKGRYSTTFEADYPKVCPVFQSNVNIGKPKLYIWNIKLIKSGTDTNILETVPSSNFEGELIKSNLISLSKEDTEALKPEVPPVSKVNYISGNTWLLDFSEYTGDNENPNALFNAQVESGAKYTFSFDYCVIGESNGTGVINAACDWANNSSVRFDNGLLKGKSTYTTTFEADYPNISPVFQSNVNMGKPKLYIWNIKLVKSGTDINIMDTVASDIFEGELVKSNLLSLSDIDTNALKPIAPTVDYIAANTWLLDFSKYSGENLDPSALFKADVEKGVKYTFSFDYCVVGETTGTSIINAAAEWGMGSGVRFSNEMLQGKGTYSTSFEADYSQIYPVFQSNVNKGKPKLYIWNIKLEKDGTDANMLENLQSSSFEGELVTSKLITRYDEDTNALTPTTPTVNYISANTWLLDFSEYTGNNENPSMLFNTDVENGVKYTFSFDYCVVGESSSTNVINAASEWGMGSNAKFDSNILQGKGSYSTTFKADYPQIYPVFQTYIPNGKPKLYIWNIKLCKYGENYNLLGKVTSDILQGDLINAGLVCISDEDTQNLNH